MDGDGRILTMRVPDPNGAWKTYFDDPRLLVPRDADRGGRRPVLPTAAGRPHPELRRRHDQARAAAGRPRHEPQLPRRVAPRGRADRRRPVPDFRARDPRRGAGDRRPAQHLRVHPVPHDVGRPPASLRHQERRRRCPRSTSRCSRRSARRRTELTGYPAVERVPRLPLRPEGQHHRRGRRLGLRPPRRARVDHRVLVARCAPRASSDFKFIEWWSDHPLEDDLKMLAWADEVAPGEGYVDWYAVRPSRARARSNSAAGTTNSSSATRRRTCWPPRSRRTPTGRSGTC